MTIEDYLSLPHVAPSQMQPGYHGVIDAFLERQGMQRKVAVESARLKGIAAFQAVPAGNCAWWCKAACASWTRSKPWTMAPGVHDPSWAGWMLPSSCGGPGAWHDPRCATDPKPAG